MRRVFSTVRLLVLAGTLAALMGLVTIAVTHASFGKWAWGISVLETTESGEVIAFSNSHRELMTTADAPGSRFVSDSGGLYWRGDGWRDYVYVEHNPESVETPRGTYSIQPRGIALTTTNGTSLAYSTEYLLRQSNVWAQELQTRDIWYLLSLTEHPYELIYDEESSNVIVAMGLLGVVVGTPDGEWLPVQVGPFAPVDFSFTNKLELLISRHWASILALSLAVSSLASILVALGRRAAIISGVVVVGALVMGGVSFVIIFETWDSSLHYAIFLFALVMIVSSLVINSLTSPRFDRYFLLIALWFASWGACLSLTALPMYGFAGRLPPLNYGFPPFPLQMLAMAAAIGSSVVLARGHRGPPWADPMFCVVGLGVTSVLVVWLTDVITLRAAYVCALTICAAAIYSRVARPRALVISVWRKLNPRPPLVSQGRS